MHKNVERTKKIFLDAIRKDQLMRRIGHRGYPLERLHSHEMSPDELKEFRKEYDDLIDQLYPKQ
jgi:deoxyadenosine/deoxycytidine kinase